MTSTPPVTPCQAPPIFAAMRIADGATSWQRAAETIAIGNATTSGLRGPATFKTDLRDGRFSREFQPAGTGSTAQVYDGSLLWARDVSGGVHPIDAPFSRRRSITDAYLARQGFLAPNDTATVACIGVQHRDGRDVVVIRVQPRDGTPADLAVDADTHLLASISERLPTTTEVTRFDDYRLIDGVARPFTVLSGTASEPADGYKFQVRRYSVLSTVHSSDFAKPVALNGARMDRGATSTSVPLVLDGRQLLVWASINGHRAMPFILDTGGHAILTARAAKALALHAVGAGVSGGSGAGTVPLQFARVSSLRIGAASIPDQTFLVIDYPYSFYERGRHQPIAGILGLEVFERFATRIDYGRKQLTLTPFASYAHSVGAAVPLYFQEDMPLANAAADGHPGLFGIDTGNAGSLILFGDFLERTRLGKHYASGLKAEGHGTGGSNSGRVVQLQRFTFSGRSFSGVPTFLTSMKSGSFSSWTEAGNFGYEILSRVVPTFDYAQRMLYIDSSPFAHAPPPNRAGFVADKDRPEVFEVERVRPGSPAAADGIEVGDRITMIDGKPAEQYSYGDLYDRVTASAGTVLRLRIVHQKQMRNVSLVLR